MEPRHATAEEPGRLKVVTDIKYSGQRDSEKIPNLKNYLLKNYFYIIMYIRQALA